MGKKERRMSAEAPAKFLDGDGAGAKGPVVSLQRQDQGDRWGASGVNGENPAQC